MKAVLPEKYRDEYWIYAVHDASKSGPNGGKWLVFCDVSEVNKTWKIIYKATMAGDLGHASKVSTALISPLSKDNGKTRVICVYTPDIKNKSEIIRVRKSLFKLGFTQPLYYKPDQMTRDRQYGSNSWTHCI